MWLLNDGLQISIHQILNRELCGCYCWPNINEIKSSKKEKCRIRTVHSEMFEWCLAKRKFLHVDCRDTHGCFYYHLKWLFHLVGFEWWQALISHSNRYFLLANLFEFVCAHFIQCYFLLFHITGFHLLSWPWRNFLTFTGL